MSHSSAGTGDYRSISEICKAAAQSAEQNIPKGQVKVVYHVDARGDIMPHINDVNLTVGVFEFLFIRPKEPVNHENRH